jgi:hypothetical protein
MTDQDDVQRRTPARSPSYPAIDLGAAIERARLLWDHERQHPTPIATIYQHWGIRPGSGGGNLAIAALRKFGLLEYEGSKDSRRGRLTDLAAEILAHPDGAVRRTAIQRAALTPVVHSELWARYKTELPSDDSLRWHLERDRDFTATGAREFIRQYRATLAFAELTDGALADADAQASTDEEETRTEETRTEETPPPPPRHGSPGEAERLDQHPRVKSYPIPISEDTDIVIEGPFPLSESEWEQLMSVLNVMKVALVRRGE